MADHNIIIGSDGNPSPQALPVDVGDKITWTNNAVPSQTITIKFTDKPAGVAPPADLPVANNATTTKVTVNGSHGGVFHYSYTYVGKDRGTRSGTINVS
jgi:plastocyanin